MSYDFASTGARVLALSPFLLAACGSASDDGLFQPGDPALSADSGGGGGQGGSGSAECTSEGTWATFVEVGVEWSSATIQPGAGTTRQWILSTRQAQDGGYVDFAKACGIGAFNVPLGSPWFKIRDIPQLNLFNEWTGVEFLEAVFDNDTLPTVELGSTVTAQQVPGKVSVGDHVETEVKPFLYGAQGIALGDEWPDVPTMRTLLVDHDQDGKDGITGVPFSGPVPGEAEEVVFTYPRLDIVEPVPRAEELHMVVRTQAGIEGDVVRCGENARVEGGVVPGTLRIDSRIVACTVVGTGEPCSEPQVTFIDSNLPVFEPNGTSVMVSMRVPDGTTCAEVREMDFGL